MTQNTIPNRESRTDFTAAELGAVAHLYRGEVYRSTTWRTRLDNTTNWAVVTTGIALSLTYADPQASPLPLALVGLLVAVFLLLEARRYRYFNVWRARARLLETDLYGPMLLGKGVNLDGRWNDLLASDYQRPQFHISYARAVGRRIRKNYAWIFGMQVIAYCGKVAIHPAPLDSVEALLDRTAVGPIPGELIILAGLVFHSTWILIALTTLQLEVSSRRDRRSLISIA